MLCESSSYEKEIAQMSSLDVILFRIPGQVKSVKLHTYASSLRTTHWDIKGSVLAKNRAHAGFCVNGH